MPTNEQKDAVIFVCQLLSNLYQPIWVFRYNPAKKYIFILAGKEESLEISIFQNGRWEFSEDGET